MKGGRNPAHFCRSEISECSKLDVYTNIYTRHFWDFLELRKILLAFLPKELQESSLHPSSTALHSNFLTPRASSCASFLVFFRYIDVRNCIILIFSIPGKERKSIMTDYPLSSIDPWMFSLRSYILFCNWRLSQAHLVSGKISNPLRIWTFYASKDCLSIFTQGPNL